MDLCEAGVCEAGALAVALHCGRTVAVHGVGAEEIGVSIAAGGKNHCMRAETLDFAGGKVAGDDAFGFAVNNHEVKHFMPREALHLAFGNLTVEGGISSEKQLLAGLASGIEGTAYLGAAERTVVQQSAVIPCERNALRYALVDDVVAHFGQTVDIGFAAAIITALDGVVEKTVDGVIVVLVVLGGVDTSLGCDRVGAAGGVADAENLNVVSKFSKGGGG